MEIKDRLTRCFAAVFPGVSLEDVAHLSTKTFSKWDSLASVTLIGVIEQEFEIEVAPLDFGDLISYHEMQNYLEQRLSSVER